MAECPELISQSQKVKRARSTNYSCKEISVLVSEYAKVKNTLECTKVPNSVKSKLWEAIAFKVSEAGTALRTSKEVKTKWANLSRISKHANSAFKQSFSKTGGGPPLNSPTGFVKDIIDLNAESEQFTGIDGGLEAGLDFSYMSDAAVVSCEESQLDNENIIDESNKLTAFDGIEVIHPANVNVDIVCETKAEKTDVLGQNSRQHNMKLKQKRPKVTQEMVWEAQLQFFKEQTATEIRRRQLMEVKEDFYREATAALKRSELSDIFQALHGNKEQ